MPAFPAQDIRIARNLARQCTELALSDEYEARRRRWRDVNELRRPDRAPVWCRPARAWTEIIPQDSLQCTDPSCRSVEYSLRQNLYKDWVGDDHIFEPWWGVPVAWDCDTEHTWGIYIPPQQEGTEQGGFRYDPPIKDLDDYDKITVPHFSYSRERTEANVARMQEILGDAMPVRVRCAPPLGPQLGTFYYHLRGMSPMMQDMAFCPERVHRLMAKLTEGVLAACRAADSTGLLSTNHHEPMFCSDPVNGTPAEGQVRLHNLWVAANSQEFDQVGPAMHEEFLLSYQKVIFQQFGRTQYGCCEDLTQKIDIVKAIPNLRVFVCSAWTDLGKVIEACGRDYTIMWRQPSTEVVMPDDMAPIRKHLDEGLCNLQGCYYQVVLRELETLFGRQDRLRDWARIGIELAEKYA